MLKYNATIYSDKDVTTELRTFAEKRGSYIKTTAGIWFAASSGRSERFPHMYIKFDREG